MYYKSIVISDKYFLKKYYTGALPLNPTSFFALDAKNGSKKNQDKLLLPALPQGWNF
jgi:hypothetical protein